MVYVQVRQTITAGCSQRVKNAQPVNQFGTKPTKKMRRKPNETVS
jgi:hypothetical protein